MVSHVHPACAVSAQKLTAEQFQGSLEEQPYGKEAGPVTATTLGCDGAEVLYRDAAYVSRVFSSDITSCTLLFPLPVTSAVAG